MRLTKVEILREAIKKIVPVLAARQIRVIQQGDRAFVKYDRNHQAELVVLPNLPDDASEALMIAVQGFLDHEVAHVLFTDARVSVKASKTPANTIYMALEDIHIERRMRREFMGSTRNLDSTWRFVQEKILKPEFDKLTESGAKESDYQSLLFMAALRAWNGEAAAVEFMDDKWKHFEVMRKALTEDLINEISRLKSTEDSLRLAVAMHNRMEEFKKELEEEQKRREREMEERKRKTKERKPEKSDESEGDESEGDEDESDEGDEDEGDESSGSKSTKNPERDDESDESDESDEGDEDEGDESDEDGGEDDEEGDDADEEGDEDDGTDDAEDDADSEEDDEDDDGDGDPGYGDDDMDDESDEDDDAEEDEEEADEDEDEDGADEESDEEESGSASGDEDDDGEDTDDPELSEEGEESDAGIIEPESFDFDPEKARDVESLLNEFIGKSFDEDVKNTKYYPFSRELDVVERFNAKDSPGLSMQVTELDAEVQKMTGQLQKKLERAIAAHSLSRHVPGYRSGKIHAPSLHRVATGGDKVFSRKYETRTRDTAVQLVIDLSGSMSGSKVRLAMEAAYALSSVLDRMNIMNEVVGFTTCPLRWGHQFYDVQKAARQFESEHGTGCVSRIEPLYIPILKPFSERLTIDRKKAIVGVISQINLYNNCDGESIEVCAKRLAARNEARKIMIVLSDGYPNAGAGNDSAVRQHLKNVIKSLPMIGIDVFGIGIEDAAVKNFYPMNEVIQHMEELPGKVITTMERLLFK